MNGAKEIEGLLGTAIDKLQNMVSVNTVVGDMVSPGGGLHIIPISKVTCGFGAGGGDYAMDKDASKQGFGGGSGAAMTVKPVGFLVVRENSVQFVTLEDTDPISKLVDLTPEIISKIQKFFDAKKAEAAACQEEQCPTSAPMGE